MTASTTSTTTSTTGGWTADRWVLARHRVRDDLAAAGLLWVGFTLFVLAVVLLVAAFRTIEVSGWEIGSQVARWFAGGLGVYATAVYLPLYVAHGYTRREAARQLAVASGVLTAVLAVLMTVGYGVERAVYAVAGWPQALNEPHLYATATDYPTILVEFLLLFAVWIAAGALGGAAFYRSPVLGFLVSPVLVLVVGATETARSPGFVQVLGDLAVRIGVVPDEPSLGIAVALTAVGLAITLPATWAVVRDTPLRTPST